MAKTAGSTPRNTTAAHQAIASVPSACGSAAKNIHSLRPVSRCDHPRGLLARAAPTCCVGAFAPSTVLTRKRAPSAETSKAW